jgi:hypothetical protein
VWEARTFDDSCCPSRLVRVDADGNADSPGLLVHEIPVAMPTCEDLSDFKRLHEPLTDDKLSVRLRVAGRVKSSRCLRMTSVDDFLNLLITRTSTSFPCRLA